MAQLLLASQADVNARDANGVTPLHDAVYMGQREMTELLLANHADVNAINATGWKYEKRNDFERESGWEAGWTPLHDAAFKGHKEIAALLLANHATVDARDAEGETPLCLAAKHGNIALVEWLLDSGAKIDSRDNKGMTPFYWAFEFAHFEVMTTLLSRRADINTRDGGNRTPLHRAAGYGQESKVRFLLDNGADREARDSSARTPLHVCADKGRVGVARMLLETGVDANATDKDGMTPLHVATSKGNTELADLLLANGALVNARANDGSLPMDVAFRSGSGRVQKLLRAASGETSVGIWPWVMQGALWGAGIVGVLIALRTVYNLASLDFSALILWVLIPALIFGRDYRRKIAYWGFAVWAMVVIGNLTKGHSFDLARIERLFVFELGASVGGWITIALFAAVFGVSSGMVVGSVVGYGRTRNTLTAPNAGGQAFKAFIFGFAVPLTFFLVTLYGYFKFVLPFLRVFAWKHRVEI
jgi:ankyrin repeat protein